MARRGASRAGEHKAPRDERALSDPRYRVQRRDCLCCGETFRSEWAGNRVCFPCSVREIFGGIPDASAGARRTYAARGAG